LREIIKIFAFEEPPVLKKTVHQIIKEEVEAHLLEQQASMIRRRPVPVRVKEPYCVTDEQGKRCYTPPEQIKPSAPPMTQEEREASDREALVSAIQSGYFDEDEMRSMRANLEGFGVPEVDFSKPTGVPDRDDYTDLLNVADLAQKKIKKTRRPAPKESPGLKASFGRKGEFTLVPTRIPK
jgi:hypothetical protein